MEAAAERLIDPGTERYDEFAHVLRQLDTVWLENHAKKRKKK